MSNRQTFEANQVYMIVSAAIQMVEHISIRPLCGDISLMPTWRCQVLPGVPGPNTERKRLSPLACSLCGIDTIAKHD